MDAVALRNLRIFEISAVDFPANELDGWLIAKARKGRLAPGVTVLRIPGPEGGSDGFVAVADSWVERLNERGGEEAVLQHLNQIMSTVAGMAATPALKAHHSASQMRSEDGRYRQSRWRRRTPPQPKVGGAFWR